ncbi:hypothetical protein ACGFZB_24860 [Streptomyces cinerochromogenes]|uniref:Uncharacterized protein n=1 Tax=Streptomyces cinerochromogenes TaxID=66422 RepID=A0ABW7B8Z1_9ACTN
MRSNAKPARPNIWRSSILILLTFPFDDAEVPGQDESGDDRVAVSVNSCGNSMEVGKVLLADGVEPLQEAFALALGEHLGEGSDVTGQGIELRAIGQDGPEPELFDLGQSFGSAEDPSRHHAGCGRLCGDRQWRGALSRR